MKLLGGLLDSFQLNGTSKQASRTGKSDKKIRREDLKDMKKFNNKQLANR